MRPAPTPARPAEALSLAWAYLGMLAKARFAYRADFIIQVASDLLLQAVDLAFIAVIFSRVTALGGWKLEEVLFVYGFFLIPFAMFNASFAALSDVGNRYVVGGDLDRVLTRPLNSLLQVQLELLRPQALNGILLGLAVLTVASTRLHLAWTPGGVLAGLAGALG
ncbi:MAG TPA: ABC-2 family transporter protein, partial [Deinococcales bacterium]|nr:ABC-2 family transporter protein [Deinococcales bacterium]